MQPARQDLPTIVYIMGYGRSGSTVTDMLLGTHPRAASMGELVYFSEWHEQDYPCGCGLKVSECDLWSEIYRRFEQAAGATYQQGYHTQLQVERLRRLPRLALGLLPKKLTRRYGANMKALYGALAEATGARYLIDSSKSSWICTGRPLALHRYAGFPVKAIFLVRDGRGTVWSEMKGSGSSERRRSTNSRSLHFLRSCLGWSVTNLAALFTTWFLPKSSVLKIRYEELCESPLSVVQRIGEFLGEDMSEVVRVVEANQTLKPNHTLAGNRVRHQKNLRFKPDYEWKLKLPFVYKQLFWLLAWPVALLFGYPFNEAKTQTVNPTSAIYMEASADQPHHKRSKVAK